MISIDVDVSVRKQGKRGLEITPPLAGHTLIGPNIRSNARQYGLLHQILSNEEEGTGKSTAMVCLVKYWISTRAVAAAPPSAHLITVRLLVGGGVIYSRAVKMRWHL